MKNRYKIIIGLTSLAAIGAIIFFSKKGRNETMRRRMQEVSDEGYEFAYDVLYPLKTKKARGYNYHADDDFF